jgi:oligopeptide/dipeptide ABC transporter ATP-binding protein
MNVLELRSANQVYRSKSLLGKSASVRVLRDISFAIGEGRTLGLVGESGSGKTTATRLALKQEKPESGQILFEGKDIWALSREENKEFRRKVQAVFQDPYSSLDPTMTIRDCIAEPLRISGHCSKEETEKKLIGVMAKIGLAVDYLDRRPNEFSGGQRQRIAIARALILAPRLLVLDEPVSSLDVSVRGQILNLLKEYQLTHKTSYLFISHDMGSVAFLSDFIAVMYFGSIVEMGAAETILTSHVHPYTELLIDSATAAAEIPYGDETEVNVSDLPSHLNPPVGCAFAPRCPHAKDLCFSQTPGRVQVSEGHEVLCHRADELKESTRRTVIKTNSRPEYEL